MTTAPAIKLPMTYPSAVNHAERFAEPISPVFVNSDIHMDRALMWGQLFLQRALTYTRTRKRVLQSWLS